MRMSSTPALDAGGNVIASMMGTSFSPHDKTCDALREWLRSHGLSTSGRKAELISR